MSTPVKSAPASGAIHNIGYRRYDGFRLGRWDVLKAMYSQTLRGSYGIGRGIAGKIFPWFLVFATVVPAFIIVAVQSQLLQDPTIPSKLLVEFNQYTMYVQVIPTLFLAVVAPQAMSRDLRFGTLPLYFSRPLTYRDYVLAKVAGLWTGLSLLLVVPLAVLYLGALLSEMPFGATTMQFLAATVGVLLLALMLTVIGLLIASVTPRRGLGVAAIITVLFGSYMAASFIQAMTDSFAGGGTAAAWAGLFSPITIYDGVQVFLFQGSPFGFDPSTPAEVPGAGPGIALVVAFLGITALCYWLLNLRYRKVSTS